MTEQPFDKTEDRRKLKIIIAKPGLDGHDRGAKVVARALRDAGFEVVYTGIRQTPEMIAETALQEDADVIGLSILSGAHLELFPRVVAELKKRGMDDVVLFCGGIIPREDIARLDGLGFKGIFGPGSSTHDIIAWVRSNVEPRGAAARP
ncbi:MAG: cobalamin B12-binding domain-containing protein [Dehalococcoidia bacterium]|nr:cobalamin B12-binding domain-containing protein [Dehalococcoidia bacterium]